jgi:hypothetical protein
MGQESLQKSDHTNHLVVVYSGNRLCELLAPDQLYGLVDVGVK